MHNAFGLYNWFKRPEFQVEILPIKMQTKNFNL